MDIFTSPLNFFVNNACRSATLIRQMLQFSSTTFWAIASDAEPNRPRIIKNFGTGKNDLIIADFSHAPARI